MDCTSHSNLDKEVYVSKFPKRSKISITLLGSVLQFQVKTGCKMAILRANRVNQLRGRGGRGICKSVIRSGRNYTFANPPSHLFPAVGLHGLHGEVGLH